ncbi:Bug family tripartite tricarboxylate transporter substrate binding protein [Limnochorda pilosa]|uniref:ABC transporter substrate-binding protein n=1 Tax=Limnochorda pilosa TaxID=1555112 RepID=A0A0K2SHQ3_LIMPI|nr:tripartite tricarboxylate transporter substrate binding protein [Limnochorda pilosa]BAS26364.1 ABC transporter substrate-binding protein [Limnochorda pilosa]
MGFRTWTRHVTIAFLSLLIVSMLSAAGVSAAYPDHEIELVAWASPGGGSDLMVRTFAEAAKGIFPVPIYVTNRPGGAGATGMAYLAGRPADGYALLGVTNNLVFTPLTQPDVRYDASDFTPIIAFGIDAKVVAVASSSPFQTLADLVEAARAKPQSVRIATFGVGSDDHITGILLERAAGVRFQYVPFSGGGQQMASVLGGHVEATVTEINEVLSQIEAGNMRVLASATERRLGGFPNVPTMRELGYDVVVPKFRGIVVKKGTPADVVDYLIQASTQVVRTPRFQEYLKQNVIEPAEITGEDFEKLIADQVETFGAILKELASQ